MPSLIYLLWYVISFLHETLMAYWTSCSFKQQKWKKNLNGSYFHCSYSHKVPHCETESFTKLDEDYKIFKHLAAACSSQIVSVMAGGLFFILMTLQFRGLEIELNTVTRQPCVSEGSMRIIYQLTRWFWLNIIFLSWIKNPETNFPCKHPTTFQIDQFFPLVLNFTKKFWLPRITQ